MASTSTSLLSLTFRIQADSVCRYTFEDVDRRKGMEWVQKYLRMKHVIVFKLSHDVLQVRFRSPLVEMS